MKKIYLFILVAIITGTASAQQLPLYSQYMLNGFLLNPAMAGSESYIPIRLTARQQWMGINDAPSTQAISAHSLLANKKMGVGGYLYNDAFGPINQTGIQATYSYHVPLHEIDSKLSFGLSISAFQFSLDESKFKNVDLNDQVLSFSKETEFVPDANFGMYLYGQRYFVGFAGAQLFEYQLKMEKEAMSNRLQRHYYFSGGYKFNAKPDMLEVEPSLLVKTTEKTPLQVDVNVKAYYKKNYWLGVSYRHNESVVGMVGVKYLQYFLGYAFDYTLSNIQNYSSGSHEIVIGINLGEYKQTGASLL